MKLTARLEKIASFVKMGSMVADLGTDHGYIPIFLTLNDIATKAYAVDIGEDPLERAKKNIQAYGVEEKVEIILSDGLKQMANKEVDTVIIAGMGGMLIKKILLDASSKLKDIPNLILSPHIDAGEVRKAVHSLGYSIVEEDLILEDEKLYPIIVCKHGIENYSKEYEYKYGKKLIEHKNKLLLNKLVEEKKKFKQLINHLSERCTPNSFQRIQEIKQVLAEIEEVILCM